MSMTIRTSYRGWDVTLQCLLHWNCDPRAAKTFTARAVAVLNDTADAPHWIDPGLQTVSLSARQFVSTALCTQHLLLQIQGAIDAVKKPSAGAVH